MNNEQKYIVVLVTAKDKRQARLLAKGLLKDKLAACVNIIGPIESLFLWQGKMDQAREVLLIIKSKQILFEKIVSKVKLLHSYQTPEIIALPLAGGSWEYLQWINEVVI